MDLSQSLSLSLFRVSDILFYIQYIINTTYSLVATPTPFISTDSSPIAGTSLILSCDYTLSITVDTDITTSATWTINNTVLDISDDDDDDSISSDGVNLIFSPLTTTHTGIYTCILTITPSSQTPHVTVQEPVESSEENIIVQSKVHSIHHVMFYYMISPSLPPSLPYPPPPRPLLSLFLSVPQPDVVINISPTGSLYAGTSLTLTCTMTLDPTVNDNEYINIEWSGHQSISEDRYTVSDVMRGSGSNYTATLIISPLAVQDDDVMITCTVTVTGGTSATANDDVTINVMG